MRVLILILLNFMMLVGGAAELGYFKGKKQVRLSLQAPLFIPKEIGESEDIGTLGIKVSGIDILEVRRGEVPMEIEKTGKGRIAIFRDDNVRVVSKASNPEFLGQILRRAGYGDRSDVNFINGLELANSGILSAANFDLLVLPYGPSFPEEAVAALRLFLAEGGDFISLGGYSFDNLYSAKLGEEVERNLLKNGGFEEFSNNPNLPEHWEFDWRAAEGNHPDKIMMRRVTDKKFAGTASFTIQVPEGAPVSWYEVGYKVDKVEPGATYICSAYVLTEQVRDGAGAYLALNYYNDDGDRISWLESAKLVGTQGWTKLEFRAAVPAQTAYLRVVGLLHGYGQAWFDGFRVERMDPFVNTRHGRARDFLEVEPEQIGVFDAGYRLEQVSCIKSNPKQHIVSKNIELKQAAEGYAAVGWVGSEWYWTSPRDRARWVPLLLSYDEYGRYRGAAGALMLNYCGEYSGSSWAYFGVTNFDLLDEANQPMAEAFVDLVDWLVRGVYLHETGAQYACYRVGEVINLYSQVSNFGRGAQEVTIRIAVLESESGKIVYEQVKKLKIKPGATEQLEWQWAVKSAQADLYRIRAQLLQNGKIIDEEESGVVIWQEKVIEGGLNLSYEDNYFQIGHQPTFMLGVQEFYPWGSWYDRNPLLIDADFQLMEDYGIRVARVFTGQGEEIEDRFNDMLVLLAQKHKIHLFFAINRFSPLAGKARDEELAICGMLAKRYKGIKGLSFDLCNEPSIGIDNNPAQKQAFNQFLRQKYGTTEAIKKIWGSELTDKEIGDLDVRGLTDEWGDLRCFDTHYYLVHQMRNWAKENREIIKANDPGRLVSVGYLQGGSYQNVVKDAIIPSADLDFANRHYYRNPKNYNAEFKEIDMRYMGVAPTTGEFGSRTHPSGGWNFESEEQQITRYLHIPHYALGLGGAFASNWHWRDPMSCIFSYGLAYQDLVPKDVAKVYRAQAIAFRFLPLKYRPPELYLLIPDNHRLGGAHQKISNAIHNAIERLINLKVDFGVINEYNLDKLPASAKALIYPLPFCPDDSTDWLTLMAIKDLKDIRVDQSPYEKLVDFVKAGGNLYLSGDISYDPQRRRTRTNRLEELCGVEFVRENYPNIQLPEDEVAKVKELLTNESRFSGLPPPEWEFFPCIKVKPLQAKVRRAKGEESVLVVNELGKGKVFYVVDPLELHCNPEDTGIYQYFLEGYAGITGNRISPNKPSIHVFRLGTNTGDDIWVLWNGDESQAQQVIRLGDTFPVLDLTIGRNKPGLVLMGRGGEIKLVEAQGAVKAGGKSIFEANMHVFIISLDNQDLRGSKALLLLPLGEGEITIATEAAWQKPVVQIGEIRGGEWVRLEEIDYQLSGGKIDLKITQSQALNLVVIAESVQINQAVKRLTQLD